MAASQNKGIASIANAENDIATEISKQWAQLGIINNVKDEKLDPNNIVQAAQALNTRKLQINTDNIVATVKKMAPEQRRLQDLYKKNPAAIPAEQPADTATNPAAGNNAFGQMATQLGKKSELEPAMAESLTWSKNFDPSRQLYRRMKQGQSQ